MTLLNDTQIGDKLKTTSGWNVEANQLFKNYELKDFKAALAFVNKIGEIAEQMNHHPDILIFSWNKVKISVSTHNEGGITEKDFELAQKIESLSL